MQLLYRYTPIYSHVEQFISIEGGDASMHPEDVHMHTLYSGGSATGQPHVHQSAPPLHRNWRKAPLIRIGQRFLQAVRKLKIYTGEGVLI